MNPITALRFFCAALPLALAVALAAPAWAQNGRPTEQSDAASGTDRPDAWVATKIKAQFAANGQVHANDVQVDVRDGRVTLRGDVPSKAAAETAVNIAQQTEGVASVDSRALRVVELEEEDR